MKLLNKTYPIPTNETWEIIDSTKLQCFMDCPRKYFYEYTLGWRPDISNNHLVFGSAVHECMEYILLNGYSAKSIAGGYDEFYKYYRGTFPADTDHLYFPKTPDRFMLMLALYANRYKDDFTKFKVLYTEISGNVVLNEKYKIYFKMDSILQDLNNNMYYSLEHKTKGGPINEYWRRDFPMSVQVGTYTHALYCLFEMSKVQGVVINGMGFKKTKRQAEFDLERLPIWKTTEQMQVWLNNTIVWMEMLENEFEILSETDDSKQVMQAFPLNVRSCGKYFGCPYLDYCSAWPNPLQKCFQPPMGMVVDFWNPMAEPSTTEMFLGGENNVINTKSEV